MRVIILCAVLSAILSVCVASPVKIHIRDKSDSSVSSESSELKALDKNSSSSEEAKEPMQNYKSKDNTKEDNSSDTSEEHPDENTLAKNEANDINLWEEEKELHNEITDINKLAGKSKRAVDSVSNYKNQLSVKDEGTIKYEKNLKLKRFRRAPENQDIPPGSARDAETSEEDSSEELKRDEKPAAIEHPGILAEKSAQAPAENPALEAAGSRRRRNINVSTEEDQSVQEQDVNEVFIFSNEKQQDSEENFKIEHMKTNVYITLKEGTLKKAENSWENKNSEEDYAQGCGDSSANHDNDSNENSNESVNTALD